MIKVTFRTQNGVYWAICETMEQEELARYLLNGVMENSRGTEPSKRMVTPKDWQIISVEVI